VSSEGRRRATYQPVATAEPDPGRAVPKASKARRAAPVPPRPQTRPRRPKTPQLQPQTPPRQPKITTTGWVGFALAAVGVATLAFLIIPNLLSAPVASRLDAAPEAASRPVVAEPEPGHAATAAQAHVAILPNQPLRLQVPAVGLDVNVGAMTVRPGSAVDPPTAGSAYWLSNYGLAGPASQNTVYIAGHTYHGGGQAAFNPFLDIADSTYTVHPGDKVIVTTLNNRYTYTVTDIELYLKTTVQQQTELWKKVPGRLVLVTCFQYNGGTSSQQNFVIYAQLDRGQS
jgi:hypothetical protein